MNITTGRLILYIVVMAGVTYMIRMLPLALIKRKIENNFVKSFLYYVPFAVLSAMIIPDIFFSTATIWSAVAGLVVAVVLSLFEKKLITVAVAACITVFIVERIV